MRLLSLFSEDLSILSISGLIQKTLPYTPSEMSIKMSNKQTSKVESVDENALIGDDDDGVSILDLPDLVLECILEKLPPAQLCGMAAVSTSLRDRCISDHLWEGHMKRKWGRVVGAAAYREWQWHIASRKDLGCPKVTKPKGYFRVLSYLWPFSWIRPSKVEISSNKTKSHFPVDSTMSCYLALETGKFWFPAQVYNRENGHVGFLLSCYDAEVSYDSRTDTFQAKYPPHGRRAVAIESGVSWERLRAPLSDTPPHDLHMTDCLSELCPGDHIEIQWRRNKEYPYGWWYGVVGHMESCDGDANHCLCHNSDTVVLEFNQYAPGSRWRRTSINRRDHREEGNEADGFYGGIMKLKNDEEIGTWKRLWPAEVLD